MNSNRADGRIGPKAQIENAKADAKAEAAQRKISPQDPSAANNNNQSSNSNNSNNSNNIVNTIETLIAKAEGVKNPLRAFIADMNNNFVIPVKTRIDQITSQLAQLTIDDNNLSNKIVALKDRSVSARAEIDRLNNELQQSQQRYQQANEAVTRLQGEVDQGRNQLNALETARAQLQQNYNTSQAIITDAAAALETLTNIITEIEGLANQRNNNEQSRRELNASLEALSNLVTTKLGAYQRIMQEVQQVQQGGMRSKGKRRTKKYKKMRGGYSYPSAGYEGAQEIVVASSRSARSAPSRSRSRNSSRRQSKRRPKTI